MHIASLPFQADVAAFSFVSLILELRDELGKNGDFILPSKFRVYDLLIKCYIEVTMKSIQKRSEKSCTEFIRDRIILYAFKSFCALENL